MNAWSARRIRLTGLLLSLFLALEGQAEDNGTQYVRLTKGLVINYGEPSLNRLKYLKVAVDVRVPNADSADLVEYHMPALMDRLVAVFSAAEEAVVKSGEGKEAIRQEALGELQRLMNSEEGEPIIEDLLFSSFVVQR